MGGGGFILDGGDSHVLRFRCRSYPLLWVPITAGDPSEFSWVVYQLGWAPTR